MVCKLDTVHENETGFCDLLASGLLNEHHELKPVSVSFRRDEMMSIAAFDIGGTALKMGIVTAQGELLRREIRPSLRTATVRPSLRRC